MSKIYVGDVGTIFDLEADPGRRTGIDLTGYTVTMVFRKPSGTTVEPAAALRPGSLSMVRYTTVAGDLNEAGDWAVQLRASIAGASWLGETANFVVHSAFD